jgi:hypothetical protein
LPLKHQTHRLDVETGSRGLCCTSKGVSLAGVALLCETRAGWVPRAADEIRVLMKVAYGHEGAPAALTPGLDVIAKALNNNDLGRAMIAALHLRLPELSWADASRIARVDQALAKYDPNEPRDERGRWTIDGATRRNAAIRQIPPMPTLPTHATGSRLLSGHGGLSPTEPPPPESPDRVFSHGAMKPTRVSDPSPIGAANDNEPPLETPNIVAYGLTKLCIAHARDPGFQTKVESCATSFQQCEWLVMGTMANPLSEDTCHWPDGSMARLKFGLLFPFPIGKPF